MSSREDKAREAEEYRRAMTIEGYEYYSRSIKVLREVNALQDIDSMINEYARNGWRLHTIQFGITAPVVYVMFERRRDYEEG